MTEQDLAGRVVAYLQGLQWEVYQEVQVITQSTIADVVAVQGPQVWVIECKTTFGFRVCGQAFDWKGAANRVSVAVPFRRWSRFEEAVLRHSGIGALAVPELGMGEVREVVAPELVRRPPMRGRLMGRLTEAQKTFARAGNAEGRRWTPFQQTCHDLARYVAHNPGCLLKDAIDNVPTHYVSVSTARSCLRIWIGEGKVRGVRMERYGRKLRLFTTDTMEGR